jgi:hypothetical protein
MVTVPFQTGVWRSLAARFVRDEEVVGSNPATPTARGTPSDLHYGSEGVFHCAGQALLVWDRFS